MAEHDGIGEYRKAGARRLRDAQELLEPPSLEPHEQGAQTRHLRAAVYLAGHAVECVLKAYLISRQASALTLLQAVSARRAQGESLPNILSVPNILGEDGHRLDLLLTLSGLEGLLLTNKGRQQDWGICFKWKSPWRYDPTVPSREYATEYIDAADRFCEWVLRQI